MSPTLRIGPTAAVGVAVTLAAVLLYAGSFDVPFYFDDSQNIYANRAIRVTQLDAAALWRAATESPSPRPVANLSFALNHYLHGYSLWGYHLVNAVLHGLAGALVFLLARDLYGREARLRSGVEDPPPRSRRARGRREAEHRASALRQTWAAVFAAAVFVSHPVQTQAVTYVVQRMTSGATLFALLAFWLFVVGRDRSGRARWLLYAGAALAWGLGLLTKPIAVTLPVALFLYEWFFRRDLDVGWLRRNALWAALPIALVGVAGLAYLGFDPLARIEGAYALRDFSVGERVMTQWRVVLLYVGLVAVPLPSRLNLLHGIEPSRSLFDPATTLLSLAALIALAGLMVALARRERLAAFCLAWFGLQLALESSVIPLEMIYEHRLYQPMFGVAVLAGSLLFLRGRWGLAPRALAGALIVGALAVGTWTRNEVWRDPVRMWSDVVAKNPEQFRPRNNLALALRGAGRRSEAIAQFRKAIAIDDGVAAVHSNLGAELTREQRFDEALTHLRTARQLEPDNGSAATNLGHLLAEWGRHAEAIAHFEDALEIDPGFAEGHYNLADSLLAIGRLDRAESSAREALRLSPGLAASHDLQGRILAARRDYAAALPHYREAIRLDPELANAHHNLGLALSRVGQHAEALDAHERAIAIDPRSPVFMNSLGVSYARRGEYHRALELFNRALKANPGYAEAERNRTQTLRLMLKAQGTPSRDGP